MTEAESSGASAAPGAGPSHTDSQAPAASAETGATGANQPIGAFGTARGSGLARGKRTTIASGPSAAAKPGEYKPTALEVIVPQREYRNPFTGEESVAAPSEPPPALAEAAPAVQASAPAAQAPMETPAAPAAAESKLEESKPELTILPPAPAPAAPALSWEHRPAGAERSAGQSGFRPGREGHDRSGYRGEGRRDGREQRRDREGFRPREGGRPREEGRPREDSRPREDLPPRPEPSPAQSGGFIGWLKRLFGSAPAPVQTEGERGHDGHRHRHRHRGRRGRGRGDRQGDVGGQPRGEPSAAGSAHSFSHEEGQDRLGRGEHSGGHRRRRRGGRGRRRDDGPRPEGQQGGGAI